MSWLSHTFPSLPSSVACIFLHPDWQVHFLSPLAPTPHQGPSTKMLSFDIYPAKLSVSFRSYTLCHPFLEMFSSPAPPSGSLGCIAAGSRCVPGLSICHTGVLRGSRASPVEPFGTLAPQAALAGRRAPQTHCDGRLLATWAGSHLSHIAEDPLAAMRNSGTPRAAQSKTR